MPARVDLWVTSFKNDDYTELLIPGISLKATANYVWKANIGAKIVLANREFVFRSIPAGQPSTNGQQVSSPGFNITNREVAQALSDVASSTPTTSPSSLIASSLSAASTSLTNPTSSDTSRPSLQSKTWFAGVVVGPTAGMSVGALALWLFTREREGTTHLQWTTGLQTAVKKKTEHRFENYLFLSSHLMNSMGVRQRRVDQ